MMKPAALWLIAAVLVISPGCVKQPDWIESTLVTVDVTGVWEGTALAPLGASGNPAVRALLDLEQEGPKVKGRFQTSFGRISGPLEGRVGGDVFHFRVIGGQGETLTGEVTVSGDEMEGLLTVPSMGGGSQTARISLRRGASPPRPQADRP